MIRLVPGQATRNVLVSADEPVRIEVIGEAIVYVYRGVEVDMEQDPVAVYDSVGMPHGANVAIES